ncbi:MAG: hypothetical protein QOG67_2956 [Verrucomicrobiota bacterium]
MRSTTGKGFATIRLRKLSVDASMSADPSTDLELEIGHVLFIDIVGYSKLLINEQRELQQQLNQTVRRTESFLSAEKQDKLVRLPTGDGMALVFFNDARSPVQCALQVSEALSGNSQLQVRMGINTGPVSGTTDVNDRSNVAGAGINIAQRVMALGDAGHILLSKRAAEDLLQYRHWQSQLHDLGEFEVKHGLKVSIVNLCTDKLGNPDLPQKLKQERRKQTAVRRLKRIAIVGCVVLAAALSLVLLFSLRRPSPRPKRLGAPLAPAKSIAVLPFKNLSDDKQNVYFTDGVQDEILMDLAKVADLKVISRTSVMQYRDPARRNLREIGEQLGVSYILEGSVQRANNRVRVMAQLIDAGTDTHVWANHYDRELADVFAIQSEIAKAIADQLQANLSPAEKAAIEQPPTDDLVAFDLYSQGKALLLGTSFSARTKEMLLQAIDLLDQAVTRDPKFFLAYCQLTYAHDIIYLTNLDHTRARLDLADAAVNAAVRLRPDAGEAHLLKAEHLYRGYLDYDGARAEVELARRTLPNDPLVFELAGFIDRRQGRWEESTQNFEREIDRDPRNIYILQQIALTHQLLRRYPEMAAVLDRALAIKPRDVDTRVRSALMELDWHADPRPLHKTIEAILREDPASAPTLADAWVFLALCERDVTAAKRAMIALKDNAIRIDALLLNRAAVEGLVARLQGDAAGAREAFTTARIRQQQLVDAQPDYGPAVCMLGFIDAALGNKEAALREGRRAMVLLPPSRDAINGPHIVEFFAIICAWTGEKELALQQLETATQLPGWFSYGHFRLQPLWDPIRDDPRFEKIVASLAPKQ